MPSRRSVALVALFWLVTTGYVVYRDVWPVFFSSGPPPVGIDLADEAAQNLATRWKVLWNGKHVGVLDTQMKYVEADDTFRFTTKYKQLRIEIAGVTVVVPELTNVTLVSRGGDLREQSAEGRLEVHWNDQKVADATAKFAGTVTDGRLTATCEVQSTLWNVSKTLDPVPVPKGQPLNPMQPVNRIANVRPGRRWVVHESDPLKEAVGVLVREKLGEFGVKLPEEKPKRPLVGEVLSEPRDLDWNGRRVSCWVIEYRRDEPEVRTWVRVSDGKVLKQEAFSKGENLTIEREE
jgi:hypothetical protein